MTDASHQPRFQNVDTCIASRYTLDMIKSFRHRGVERFFHKGTKSGIQSAHVPRLARQLQRLDAAHRPEDMNIPGWKLHPLKGPQKGHMTRMFNPPHPGESIREDVLPTLGLTVTDAARQLGVARVTLSRLINGQSGISADMARRLETWLGGPEQGPSAESWLRLQSDYDLWQAMQSPAPNVVPAHRPD